MPPPRSARAGRPARQLNPEIVGAWVRRDIEHTAADKVQNERQNKVFQDIRIEKVQAAAEIRTAKILRQRALDALEAGNQAELRSALLGLGTLLDKVTDHLESIDGRACDGQANEAGDERRALERTDENRIKIARLSDARRGQPDGWRPEPDGPGAA